MNKSGLGLMPTPFVARKAFWEPRRPPLPERVIVCEFSGVHSGTRRINPARKAICHMPVRYGRQEKRIGYTIPVEISNLQQPGAPEWASTENVSSLGARVLTQRPKQLDEHVTIRPFAGDRRTEARVVYCQRLPTGRFGVGMQFLGVPVHWPDKPLRTPMR